MFGFIVMACHISLTTMKLECNWIVKETFTEENACNVYEKGYNLLKGEQFGLCDELKNGAKKGDNHPILILKK
ncbi:hypothetical protein [Salmonella phage NINP13076]|uniref:Uncharacterized protein n=1 Tax=Salmonella phage SalP219 TaxID=3158864 RepID=A0AAU7PJ48_9CAUD|nr:hypothetical protein [Salmonella phage NINP13076]